MGQRVGRLTALRLHIAAFQLEDKQNHRDLSL
jgi:hypothetical protein